MKLVFDGRKFDNWSKKNPKTYFFTTVSFIELAKVDNLFSIIASSVGVFFELFKSLIDSVNKEILSFLFKAEIATDSNKNVQEAGSRKPLKVNTSKDEIPNTEELRQRNRAITNRQQNSPVETIVRTKPKVGRND